jgi:hypothetical protein
VCWATHSCSTCCPKCLQALPTVRSVPVPAASPALLHHKQPYPPSSYPAHPRPSAACSADHHCHNKVAVVLVSTARNRWCRVCARLGTAAGLPLCNTKAPLPPPDTVIPALTRPSTAHSAAHHHYKTVLAAKQATVDAGCVLGQAQLQQLPPYNICPQQFCPSLVAHCAAADVAAAVIEHLLLAHC